MEAVELLRVIHALLKTVPIPGIAEVSMDNDNNDGELIITDTDGREFVFYSSDIEPDEDYTGP